jgi:hypothetical protein
MIAHRVTSQEILSLKFKKAGHGKKQGLQENKRKFLDMIDFLIGFWRNSFPTLTNISSRLPSLLY